MNEEMTDLEIGENSFRNLQNKMKAFGFREGVAKGRDLALQEGFNIGYSEGFKLGEYMGMSEGMSRCQSHIGVLNQDHISNDDLIKQTNETCLLCPPNRTSEDQMYDIYLESFENLKLRQERHNVEIIKKLPNFEKK